MGSNTLKEIGEQLANAVDWFKAVLRDEAIRRSIAEDLGLAPGAPVPDVSLQADSVTHYRSQANPDKEAFITLLDDLGAVYRAFRAFYTSLGVGALSAVNQATFSAFDLLALNYVRLYFPRTFYFLQFASTIVEDSQDLISIAATLGQDPADGTPPPGIGSDRRTARVESAVTEWARLHPVEVVGFAKSFVQAGLLILSPFFFVFEYTLKSSADEVYARLEADRTLTALAAVLAYVTGLKGVIYGWDDFVIDPASPRSGPTSTTPKADGLAAGMLTFAIPFDQRTGGTGTAESLRVSVAIKTKSGADRSSGLFVGIGGTGELDLALSPRWNLTLQAGAVPAISIFFDPDRYIYESSAHGPLATPLRFGLVSVPDPGTDVSFAFPNADETRIELGQLALTASYDGSKGGVELRVLRGALVIATKDHDGFLARILPSDGLRIPFDLAVGLSSDKGFYKDGAVHWPTDRVSNPPAARAARAARAQALLAAGAAPRLGTPVAGTVPPSSSPPPPNIPNLTNNRRPELGTPWQISIGKELAGVRLDHLNFRLGPSQNSPFAEARLEVSATLSAKLGPVTASVDRLGFEVGLSFPDDASGNFGFGNFALGFKAPSGVGLDIDASLVKGGGFLFFDRGAGQYAGFVELTVAGPHGRALTVKALGIISTRLPDGSKGFSFVVLITAEGFQPIPIGLGFTLTAIGGLYAVNRTCNTDFLRDGLKNKTLDSLLFPKDVVRNAPQIFGALTHAFPASEGSYLFGPVLRISWGTPALLHMDLALIVELGSHKRLTVLGRVAAIMPSETLDLVRLQMNALGVIDFDQGSVALDAVLFDSRLAGKFAITGAMALRAGWGAEQVFALSIGGFHPAFKPPAAFPTLPRLAISLADSDNFRLRMEGYFALTANTLQIGAHVDLYARAGGFSIEGLAGFDVLIHRDPFFFIADITASLQLKHGSTSLFKVGVDAELTGPRPLHARGKATFEIFWCDFSIPFDHTLIDGDPPPPPAPVPVMPQLKAALDDPRNWTGQLPAGQPRVVALRETAVPGQIALHPLGQLSVRQTVVPLDVSIARFASAAPADGHLFHVAAVSLGGQPVAALAAVKDFFAPAQFLDLGDDDALAAPSFESMNAGVTVTATAAFLCPSAATDPTQPSDVLVVNELVYDTVLFDAESEQPHGAPPSTITGKTIDRHLALGAAARGRGVARYAQAAPARNTLAGRGWSIASASDGTPAAAPGFAAGRVASYTESFQALGQLRAQDPARARTLMLVRVAG